MAEATVIPLISWYAENIMISREPLEIKHSKMGYAAWVKSVQGDTLALAFYQRPQSSEVLIATGNTLRDLVRIKRGGV